MKKLALPTFLVAAVFMAFSFTNSSAVVSVSNPVMTAGCCGVINATLSGFCSGTQTYTLNNESAAMSVPYTPGTQVELDPNAKYSITVSSTGTCALTISYFLCGNTDSEVITVYPNKPVTVELIQGSGPFCF